MIILGLIFKLLGGGVLKSNKEEGMPTGFFGGISLVLVTLVSSIFLFSSFGFGEDFIKDIKQRWEGWLLSATGFLIIGGLQAYYYSKKQDKKYFKARFGIFVGLVISILVVTILVLRS